jgi:hypothetical protein
MSALRAELAAAARAEVEANPPEPATAASHPVTHMALQEAATERQQQGADAA